jgi:hypothetical protein
MSITLRTYRKDHRLPWTNWAAVLMAEPKTNVIAVIAGFIYYLLRSGKRRIETMMEETATLFYFMKELQDGPQRLL